MKNIIKKISLVVISITSLVLIHSSNTNALSGSEFNAGRIIDDAIFFNSSSMSISDIQNFLMSKVDCDFDGSEMVGGITRAQYAAQRGYPTTFTCLPQYKENPSTHENNIGRPDFIPPGSQSAAHMIYNASVYYGINPRVMLVLLQKEQGFITDEWPVPRQYQIATGYGCPDTAPCDEQYYGFYNQINKAAYQFKRYVNNSSAYRYKAGQVNSVYWSPTVSCGSSSIYIENGATAALYNYTPYRPNQAALDNLYGTGDGCSAYGNRNFWRYYRDWFGQTIATVPDEYTGCMAGLVGTYRMYNRSTGEHFISNNYQEIVQSIINSNGIWVGEGVAFCSRYPNIGATYTTTVYRVYNRLTHFHLFTANLAEKNALVASGGWLDEGIAFYALPTIDSYPNTPTPVKPIYRVYNRYNHDYLFTANLAEKNALVASGGWLDEGIVWYAH